MENNFINPKTKKEYFIPLVTTMFKKGIARYYEGGKPLKRNGVLLEKIVPEEIEVMALRTDTKNR